MSVRYRWTVDVDENRLWVRELYTYVNIYKRVIREYIQTYTKRTVNVRARLQWYANEISRQPGFRSPASVSQSPPWKIRFNLWWVGWRIIEQLFWGFRDMVGWKTCIKSSLLAASVSSCTRGWFWSRKPPRIDREISEWRWENACKCWLFYGRQLSDKHCSR